MIMHTRMNNENNIESLNESLSIESLETTLEQNKPIEEIETKAKKIKNLEKKVISYFNSLEKLFKELKLERQQNDVQEGVEDSKLEKLKEALLVWVGIRNLFNEVVKEKHVSKQNKINLGKKFDEFNSLLNELRNSGTESKSKLQINEEAEPEAEQVQIEQIEPEAEQTQEVVENEAENTVIDTVLSKDNAQLEETTASNENNEKTEPKEKDNEEIKDFESVLFEIIENINTIDEFSEVLEKCKAACEQFNEKEKLLEALKELQVIYNSLKEDNSRENDIPSEKLEDLKNILLIWREMYFVVNTSFIYENNELSEDKKEMLNSFYEGFIKSLNTYKEKYGLNSEEEQTKSEQTDILNESNEQDTMQTELEDSPTQVEYTNSVEEDVDSLESISANSETENEQDQEEATTQEEAIATETKESDDGTQQEEVKKGGFLGKIVDSVKSKVSGFFRREKGKSEEQSQEGQPEEEQKPEGEEGKEGIESLTEEQKEALEKITEKRLDQMWEICIKERKEKIWEQIKEEITKLKNLRIEIIKAGRDYLSANLKNESDKKSEFDKKMKEYEFCLKEMISLIVVVFDDNNLIEEQLDQELQLLSDEFTKLNERPDMKARDRRYFKDIEEEIKNYFSKGHEIIVKQIESLIKSKKVELKTSLDNRFAEEIKKEIDSILNEKRINTIKQSELVEQLISKINNIDGIQEKIDELIRELILSDKTDEEINDYITSINNILEKGASNLVSEEESDKIKAWLLEKFGSKEVENIYNDQIIPKLNKIIVQTLFFEIEKDNKKELTQEELQKLVEEAVKRNLFLVQQVEDVQNIDYVLYQADGDLIDLSKEVENESIDNQDLELELIEESKLKLLDSKKIGKGENIYNFFVGQNLKMKNGSAVLVREIKSDFIVVMEQSGNLIPIFHDEIKDKLQETPSLEMSKLSGSESKEQEKWNDLLGSVRDKFIRQPSSPDIFWEYQDALKQYFEANQDSFNNNYETFLDKEKTILEALGNKNFESVIENLKQSFAVAKEAMDNKARAEKKRAEEKSKRNKTNETQTSSKEKTVEKSTTPTSKSTASLSSTNVSSGGGITRVEKQKDKESGKKFEFAGQEWDQVMTVYLLGENNKSTIIINKVEDEKIFFSAKGIEQKMNEKEWLEMIYRNKQLEEKAEFEKKEQEQAEEERIREIENLSDLYKSETTDSQETKKKQEISENKVKDIFLKLSENFIGDSWVEDIKNSLKGKIEKAETIDETFFESLSPDEQFVFRFINGLYKESGTIQGFVNSDQLFYATNNEKGNNLFIIVDKSFKNILLKHDKPVRNYDGTLVEVEDGNIHPVKYNIVNNKIILERV
ncbi:MAG: hypothetical protein ACOXZY_01285 [Patescibacteria group bacterium]|jgi:hypothetical protein